MGLLEAYHYYNYEVADLRTRDWMFLKEPFTLCFLSFAYLYFVLRCGPRYMKDKPPYTLKTFVQIYNVLQVIINFTFVYMLCKAGWITDIWFYCIPFTYPNDPVAIQVATVMWVLVFDKLLEYVETIVFVLRKKQDQISFLHLYHHVSTLHVCWYLAKYFPERMGSTFVILNCGVHVLMYSYYFLSSCGDSMRRYVHKWKRYVTVVQLVQFCIMITYAVYHSVTNCKTSSVATSVLCTDIVMNLFLFLNFYKNSYMKKKIK